MPRLNRCLAYFLLSLFYARPARARQQPANKPQPPVQEG